MHQHGVAPEAVDDATAPRVLLVGSPNVGKSVLFGLLTGRYVIVSNYPGTTVEIARGSGELSGQKVEVVDTPGANSLSPNSEDEKVARDVVLKPGEKTVVQVADAKNLRRALFLTAQLAELEIPTVLALNMWDEAQDRGIETDLARIRTELGIPVIATVATERRGFGSLVSSVSKAAVPSFRPSYGKVIEGGIRQVEALLPDGMTGRRGIALMLLAGDSALEEDLIEGKLLSDAQSADGDKLSKLSKKLKGIREKVNAGFSESVALVVQRRRAAHADELVDKVVTRATSRGTTPGFWRNAYFFALGPALFYAVGWLLASFIFFSLSDGAPRFEALGPLGCSLAVHGFGLVSMLLYSVSTWRREYARGGSAAASLARLSTHPVGGGPLLILVLWVLYIVVGVFGAGDCVDFLETRFFGTLDSATFESGEEDETSLKSAGGSDMFILRYDAGGTLVWAKRGGGAGEGYGEGVAVAADGSVVVTGRFEGTADFGEDDETETSLTSAEEGSVFVARYDTEGVLVEAKLGRSKLSGAGAPAQGSTVAVFADRSRVEVGGFTDSRTFGKGESNETILASSGQEDIFVARYNVDGSLAWARRAGGAFDDSGQAVAVLPDGSVVVVGKFTGGYVGPVNDVLSRGLASVVGRESIVYEFFFGESSGLISTGLTYAVAIVFPIVTLFFLAFALMEDSGYLPRLALLADRTFKRVGLSGKAVLPMVLGLGCGTMATMTTRILETRKQRLIAILLLALAVPCSAQLGIITAVLAGISPMGVLIYVGVIALVLLAVGWGAAQILEGGPADFLIEIPPFRRPGLKNVVVKTYHRVKWFMKEAVPLFLIGTMCLFFAEKIGLLGVIETVAKPVVTGLLGLPVGVTIGFIMGFLRRDYGAVIIFEHFRRGNMAADQALVALVVITLFVPCLAHMFVCVRELGLKKALLMNSMVFVLAFLVGGAVRALIAVSGVSITG